MFPYNVYVNMLPSECSNLFHDVHPVTTEPAESFHCLRMDIPFFGPDLVICDVLRSPTYFLQLPI